MSGILNFLKAKANVTYTENGAKTYLTSCSDCLDLFFKAGAMRNADEADIRRAVDRAYAEDPHKAMKIIFFARDVRGGLGERRFFRIALRYLADIHPESVKKNIPLIAEYGRYDDLISLMGTSCEGEAVELISRQLSEDVDGMKNKKPVSLLAKWLPSVNTSSRETVLAGKRLCKALAMSERDYRRTLSALRRYTDIIENRLRTRDYTFDYSKQPAGAMFKYRQAFIRNDGERYVEFIKAVKSGKAQMHAATLYPYEIVRSVLQNGQMSEKERLSLDVSWRELSRANPIYGNSNALAVIDGSGSMTWGAGDLRPIDAALSLGIFFAENIKGAFKNHFITFSEHPRLVEIKGSDITDKVRYCDSFNEVANTNLEAVFDLILNTALENKLHQEDIPGRLYIISDMEFDYCVTGGNNETMFNAMKHKYERCGYALPEIVFWNVNSRSENIPVRMSQTGAALVSGNSPSVFNMVTTGGISPAKIMEDIIGSERYKAVAA